MAEPVTAAPEGAGGEDAALDGNNYEVIRRRLAQHGRELGRRAEVLNGRRKEVFGGTELTVIANERVRTENNCVPSDIVSVHGLLLFAYNVFIGLKSETSVADVFALHRFEPKPDGTFDCAPVPLDSAGGFLLDPQFEKDFQTLYRYYRQARVLQLVKSDSRLLAVFQIGASHTDIKVFRWRIEGDGRIVYMDDRGADDYAYPRAYDFAWTELGRDDQVSGRHPHLSVADTLFIDNTGGTLTIKIEDNTESGGGIYDEPLDDQNQTLDDARFAYARVGALIVLRVLPFRETRWRYLVYDGRSQRVARIDAIGQACLQLPEDHGILFPGGFYLQSGTYKVFDGDTDGLEFKRAIRAPNGEDVLYVFHRRRDGHYALFSYNLIRKEVQTPIHCHGYSFFDDGRLVVFRALSEEPTRVHPMQVWQTPYTSAEHAASAPTDGSFLAKVGNAELVRGLSDCLSIARLAGAEAPARQTFEELVAASGRALDAYYWLGHPDIGDLKSEVEAIRRSAELVIDEFEKVLALRSQASGALVEIERAVEELVRGLRSETWSSVQQFLGGLTGLRGMRGRLITLREVRYIDLGRLDHLEAEVVENFDRVSRDCVGFLLRDEAFGPLGRQLDEIAARAAEARKVSDLEPLRTRVRETSEGLDLLGEVVADLQVDDATKRTTILEGISVVFAHLNRVRAEVEGRHRELLSHEGKAEFGAQFKLLGQSVASALAMCDTPERCDEELARVMVQLEELEGRFADLDEFLADLAAKREDIYEAFSGRKQALLDERQRRAQNIIKAAERILEGVGRRVGSLGSADAVNGYFASDAMVLKLRDLGAQLAELGDTVKAEELAARLQTARQNALRGLRDRLDLFEDGDRIIRLGRHRFSVNTQPLDLTIVPRDGEMALHLGGTDFYEPVSDPWFAATRPYWGQDLVSETAEVYRGEYLAASILFAAEGGLDRLTVELLHDDSRRPEGLLERVRNLAQERYDEGYERGIHDADAAAILDKLLGLRETVGLLRYPAPARAAACLYWAWLGDDAARRRWHRQALSLGRLRSTFRDGRAFAAFGAELGAAIGGFFGGAAGAALGEAGWSAALAGAYLAEELTAERPRFVLGADAEQLRSRFLDDLELHGQRAAFEDDLRDLRGHLPDQLAMARAWLGGFAAAKRPALAHAVLEAAAQLCCPDLDREVSSAVTEVEVSGLVGHHPRIRERKLTLRIDEFLARLGAFAAERVPGFRAYRQLRAEVIAREKQRLRLGELVPRVMTSFVRNKLINDVYLPLIGDNLAKQIGATGAGKRTDLSGLLLLISPPGYGKTTLMEYVAERLGLVFVKVNGPSLGHAVHSLDPEEAPNATARQEVDKINLALEMSNNVMLYLDDIQHTHPELLQKFISLCDAQRRIEGVWKGRTRTYDMRGKKFCVVMAGNPYTESGDKFRIPDMLANRADIYNLGDILHGKDDLFALSYLENSLTSSPVLAPLATREQADVYKLVRLAQGEEVPSTELGHGYSAVELSEITAVLRHLFRCRDLLLRVNQQYIASAAQDDRFRTEPPFKLQGSYRNMNKLAEKVVAAMTETEVEALLDDHYLGEAQTLTVEAEQNLLKLAEMRGRLGPEQATRWTDLKAEFVRQRRMGSADDDPVTRIAGTLGGLGAELGGIRDVLAKALQRS